MLGKTHMMVGIAASVMAAQPETPSKLLTVAAAGGIGALISDIDVGTSKSHKEANKVIGLAIALLAAVCAADFFLKAGVMKRIENNSGLMRIICGALLFILICAWGKEQPHRSFMHSLSALLLLSASLTLIYPPVVPWFAIGFATHLATDIFNYKKVKLLYPWKKGVCLKMFHAHGIANTAFFIAGCAVTALEVLYLLILKKYV